MNPRYRSLVFVLYGCAALAPSFALAEERATDPARHGAAPQQAGPPRGGAAPAADPFPNACVDCHLNYPERKMDVRLSTLMEGWREKVEPTLLSKARTAARDGARIEGRHPEAKGALASVPDRCMACHREASSRAPEFARLIHAVHLTGGPENHFVADFQGKCTHCHKLDPATGSLRVPSAPER